MTKESRRLRFEGLEEREVPSTLSYSTNWAGYAVTAGAGSVSQVSGSWVVPTVSSSVSGYSSAWVGIDGYNSSTVEQIGTDSDYLNGQAQYYAWYEMYPAYPVNLSLTIHSGDTISASVTYTGPKQFTLSITDVTTGGAFSTTQTSSSAQRSSAEWIQEAPSSGGVLPLSNFGTINFSGVSATISGTTGPADQSWSNTTLYQSDMITKTGSLKATTSSLSDSGNPLTSNFSVTWVSSGSGGKVGGHKNTDNESALDLSPDAATALALSAFDALNATFAPFVDSAAPATRAADQVNAAEWPLLSVSAMPQDSQPPAKLSEASPAMGRSAHASDAEGFALSVSFPDVTLDKNQESIGTREVQTD
jgi:hypothetical protein